MMTAGPMKTKFEFLYTESEETKSQENQSEKNESEKNDTSVTLASV